ncbi:hypothetical protein Mal15_56250 [Stieleria maiorica]|uniref:Transposase n=1 Tax=Stieleria maiorica TaxID=2795974 RepID=A0A5B9MR88_9BACT|nr:transposase [Stieleria maiorica]QEG01548.1 hypothetical protein Mal15_56250 [Stieleria maiorica]
MRKRFSAPQWAAWMEQFESSELTVAEFCQQIHVSVNSFYVWRRKLKASPVDLFVPVVVKPNSQVCVDFPCGAVLRVDNQIESLRPVLETLAQIQGAEA